MITTILLTIISLFLAVLNTLLPVWSPYPVALKTGITAMFTALMKLNFIFPVSEFYTVIQFIADFEGYFFTAIILFFIINFARGRSGGDI